MVIAQLLSPVHALGPGNRVCLWTQGCSKNCKGCISPEMQPFTGNQVDENTLCRILRQVAVQGNCTGLTISGGDPFEQSPALFRLLTQVREHFPDILVYTGYTLSAIQEGAAGEDGKACLSLIDVLIDGTYVEALNTPDCVLRGSRNQIIHYLNPAMQESYAAYMQQGRILESFVHRNNTIITGIFNKENV